MQRNYSLSQRWMAYLLLVNLFLQSCTSFSNSLIPIEENQAQTTQIESSPTITRQLEGAHELVAQGGHIVTVSEQGGQLQADVKVNAPVGFSKSYKGLPVYVGVETDPREIAQLDKRMQARLVEVKLPTSRHTGYVHLGERCLMGGMIREEDDDKDQGEDKEQSFTELEKIGEGNFGVVYKGLWKRKLAKSISVAIKTLRNLDKFDGSSEELAKETKIMESIIHKNIVRFFGVHDIKIGNHITKAIITELMEGGSVESFLSKASKGAIKPMDILSIALDAAVGMRYLHENDIIHRDLASRNLLLSISNGKPMAKVSDFGLSRQLPSEQEGVRAYYKVNSDNNPIRWSAPELFIKKQVSKRSDLWSFGVVLYELFKFCKVLPYEDFSNGAIIKKVKAGEEMYKYLTIPDCPEGVQELVNSCMNNNSSARPDFDEIIPRLKKTQERVRDNNSWKIGDENAEEPIDLGSEVYEPSEGSEEEEEDKGAVSRSLSSREEKRVSLEERGAEQGRVVAQTNLAEMNENGQVVDKDAREEVSSSKATPAVINSPSKGGVSVQPVNVSKPASTRRDWTRAPQIQTIKGHTKYVHTLIELRDGSLASGSGDKTIKIWDRTGNCIKTLVGHTDYVQALIELRDGSSASGSRDKTIKIWDRDGNCIKTLVGHKGGLLSFTRGIYTLIELSDGRLASGAADDTIKIWDRDGKCINTLKGHTGTVNKLIELRDGRLASGSDDNTIKLWNKSGNCIKTLVGHTNFVNTLIELTDGLLASGSSDNTIKIWDRLGNCIINLEGHKNSVFTLIELRDGLLATGSADQTIKIWDRDGNCIKTLEEHTSGVKTLIELSDGRLASGSGDQTIKIWDFPKLN
jgi:WD40 repeat protein